MNSIFDLDWDAMSERFGAFGNVKRIQDASTGFDARKYRMVDTRFVEGESSGVGSCFGEFHLDMDSLNEAFAAILDLEAILQHVMSPRIMNIFMEISECVLVNPKVLFSKNTKAGKYDDLSDADFNMLLDLVRFISQVFGDRPDLHVSSNVVFDMERICCDLLAKTFAFDRYMHRLLCAFAAFEEFDLDVIHKRFVHDNHGGGPTSSDCMTEMPAVLSRDMLRQMIESVSHLIDASSDLITSLSDDSTESESDGSGSDRDSSDSVTLFDMPDLDGSSDMLPFGDEKLPPLDEV